MELAYGYIRYGLAWKNRRPPECKTRVAPSSDDSDPLVGLSRGGVGTSKHWVHLRFDMHAPPRDNPAGGFRLPLGQEPRDKRESTLALAGQG